MAEEGEESIIEWLEINIDQLSGGDKIQLISELCDTMNPQELMAVGGIIAEKRTGREEDIRELLLKEFRERAESMGVRFETLLPGRQTELKYRHPETGQTWSGRGKKPKWITDAEAQWHNIEEFRIK